MYSRKKEVEKKPNKMEKYFYDERREEKTQRDHFEPGPSLYPAPSPNGHGIKLNEKKE